jgi:Ca2+-binding EF-hand superfamily protein
MSPIVFSRDQSQKDAVEAQFNEMDANGDGKLALDEHAAGARKMFDIMDVNKDGKVTVMEMDATHEKVTGRPVTKAGLSSAEKIKAVDGNGDGILTAEEHAAGARKMFEKMDLDKDSFISKEELAEGHKNMIRRVPR